MSENNFPAAVDALLNGMNTVLSTKTVVGEATQIGDTIILPLVDVTFGVGAGASVHDKKNGTGGGIGGKMSPSAVLVIKDGYTKLVNIKNQDSITKILDMVPDVIDRFAKDKTARDEDAVDNEQAVHIAFPEKA